MPTFVLDNLDDPRLDIYRQLPRTNQTRWSGQFVAEGDLLVRRLLASRFPVESVLAGRKFLPRIAAAVPDRVPLLVVPDPWLDSLVGFKFHRGVLACGRRLPEPEPASLVDARPDVPVTLVACADVIDPDNLGGILRNAAAFGALGVLLSARCPDPFSRRVLRVSMGTPLYLPVVRCPDLAATLAALRASRGLETAATVLDERAVPLARFKRPGRLAVVLGNEATGLPAEWAAACDHRITVPMAAGHDSLNVAAASAVFLYAVTASAASGAAGGSGGTAGGVPADRCR